MTSVFVSRLTFGTIFRILAIGLGCALVPLCILDAVGLDIINLGLKWNDQPVTGLRGVIIAPILGIVIAGLLALFVGGLTWVGLWMFSFFRPIKLEYRIFEQREEGREYSALLRELDEAMNVRSLTARLTSEEGGDVVNYSAVLRRENATYILAVGAARQDGSELSRKEVTTSCIKSMAARMASETKFTIADFRQSLAQA